jgi:hypothetical protein
MAAQQAVTVRAWIRPEQMDALRADLAAIEADLAGNALIPFGHFDTVHFARFVILEEATDLRGQPIPASLVYAAIVDGTAAAHLEALARFAPDGVDRVFDHCRAYPAPGARTDAGRIAFLRRWSIPTQAFYANTRGRTVRQAREEARLREAVESYLDGQLSGNGGAADGPAIQRSVREYVGCEEALRFALQPAPGLAASDRLRDRFRLGAHILGLLILSPALLVLFPFWLVLLRIHETKDAREERLRVSAEEHPEARQVEDQIVQNQLSAVGNVKPGPFRILTLRALLWSLDLAARHYYDHGDLGTFRPLGLNGVDTIHFAQWIVIDEGRRVLFLSNYDGSLVSYMDDFVNKVAWGLNAVFSNGETYPATRWLFLGGAHDEQGFKAFLFRHQIPTQAWYSAYPHDTAVNLANNAEIRRGLAVAGAGAEGGEWLARL